jgi:peptidoglycan/xylan/chitin deacetylase (PgdA/CDA1 family)
LYRFRTCREFAADLDWLLQHYRPVALDDLLDALGGGRALPAKSFLLSFDDGFREMHDVVMPILLAKGVPAVFFVMSGCVDNTMLCLHQQLALIVDRYEQNSSVFPAADVSSVLDEAGMPGGSLRERLLNITYADRDVADMIAGLCGCDPAGFLKTNAPYLTSGQIRTLLENGFAVGAHSIDHPLYAELPLEEQLRQTRESSRFVRDRFGVGDVAFAFPHSDSGVSREFFRRTLADGSVSVSFGTGGMLRDAAPRHFQRFSMEKVALPVRTIVGHQYARRYFRTLTGRGTVTHADAAPCRSHA